MRLVTLLIILSAISAEIFLFVYFYHYHVQPNGSNSTESTNSTQNGTYTPVSIVLQSRSNETNCIPGKAYTVDCNRCICNPDGTSYSCTLMNCSPLKPYQTLDSRTSSCTVYGEQYKDDCNYCYCQEAGRALCTTFDCTRTKCVPLSRFWSGCLFCVCNADGTDMVCSDTGCRNETFIFPDTTDAKQSNVSSNQTNRTAGGYSINNDGLYKSNRAEGFADFTDYANSANTVGDIEDVDVIDPMGETNDESNVATKTDHTKPTAPTKPTKPNKPTEPTKLSKPIMLTDSTDLIDPTNLANLHDTTEPTETETTELCTPGERRVRGGQTCICDAAGEFSICTRASIGSQPSCRPGETIQVDCNTCACDMNGQYTICTRMLCDPPECRPGETTYQDCNTCHCSAAGRLFCTKKACPPQSVTITTASAASPATATPKERSPKKCSPGQTIQRDCNTCACDAQGEYSICTQMECEPIDLRAM
nr:MAG: hypothetical protein AmFV_00045 [Apis mellifera filamentous virus]